MHLNQNYNNREGNLLWGYKVDMSEVHNMQKSIDSSLSAINTKVSTLSSSINNLIY